MVWEPDSVQSLTNPLTGIPALAANPEIWMEVIINKNKELAYGSGTLDVTNGSPNVNLNPDSSWDLDNTDIGRELYIEGFPYSIVAIGGRRTFTLNEPYAQANNPAAHYLVSSVRVGAPWEVIVPTNLVVLADQAQKLNAAGPVNTIDPEDIAWLPVPQANQ